jgi:hypothetical protein
MNNLTHNKFGWQNILNEALAELNPDKLKERVTEVKAAICNRPQVPGSSTQAAERRASSDASNALLFVKRNLLAPPDRKPEEG